MRFEQLKYLSDIAETESMNATAKRIFITQPALSQAMNNLEQELDCDLFVRSKKGVSLTKKGEIALKWSKILLNDLENFKKEIWLTNNELSPEDLKTTLNIGATSISYIFTVIPTLVKLTELYPDIQINAFQIKRDEIETLLLNKTVDIVIHPSFEQNSISRKEEIVFEKFYSEPLFYMANSKCPICKQKDLHLSELLEYPLIIFGNYDYSDLDLFKYISNFGTSKVATISTNPTIIRQALLENKGICLCVKSAYNQLLPEDFDSESIKIIKIKEHLSIDHYVSHTKDHVSSNVEKVFLKYVEQEPHNFV